MTNAVKISVIIPIYNMERYLAQCIDSIIAQSLNEIEIICVDDGSNDSTPEILKNYAEADVRIKVFRQKNSGPGAARNFGMEKACGEYVVFLDSDDFFEPSFLEKMLNAAKKNDADITVCAAKEYYTETGAVQTENSWLDITDIDKSCFSPAEINEKIFTFTKGWAWDKLYKRSFIKEKGLSFPDITNSEDLVFVFSSLAAAEKIAVIALPFIYHRVNLSASVSASRYRRPDAILKAIDLFKMELDRLECYERFEGAFFRWMMEFIVWNITDMSYSAKGREFYNRAKTEYLCGYHYEKYPVSYYKKTVYIKYKLVKLLPYSVFSLLLKVYNIVRK